MTGANLIDYLTYCSYRAQRELHGMSAENAKRLFGAASDAMEAQYQAEKAVTITGEIPA